LLLKEVLFCSLDGRVNKSIAGENKKVKKIFKVDLDQGVLGLKHL
jgi:hypothetical protein